MAPCNAKHTLMHNHHNATKKGPHIHAALLSVVYRPDYFSIALYTYSAMS
jgi:hypothetical protein